MHKNGKIQKQKKNLTSQPKPNAHHNEQLNEATRKLTTQQTSLHLCRPHDLFLLHRLSHMNVIAAIKKKINFYISDYAENSSCNHIT